MLIRLALILPAAIFGLLIVALVPLTEQGTRTGLSEGDRLWFFLTVPPLYVLMSMYVSAIYVEWFGTVDKLPVWLQRSMREAEGFSPDRGAERGAEALGRTMPRWRRLGLAVGVFVQGLLLLALVVPFAVLLLWLRRGFYAPWEAVMVAGAGVATLLWLVFLAYRLRK
jgi:hypothetical protein